MRLTSRQIYLVIFAVVIFILSGAYYMYKIRGANDGLTTINGEIPEGAFAKYNGSIKVAVEANYYPLSFFNPRTHILEGFDIEITRNICDRLKIKCEMIPMPFGDIMPALILDDVQLAVAGISETAERSKYLAFSVPYYNSSSMFVGSTKTANKIDLLNPDSMVDCVIGVQSNTVHEEYLRRFFDDYKSLSQYKNLKSYASYEELVKAFYTGKVDMIFVESFAGYELIRSDDNGQFFDILYPDSMIAYFRAAHIAVSQANKEEIERINLALKLMHMDGSYNNSQAKYFPFLN